MKDHSCPALEGQDLGLRKTETPRVIKRPLSEQTCPSLTALALETHFCLGDPTPPPAAALALCAGSGNFSTSASPARCSPSTVKLICCHPLLSSSCPLMFCPQKCPPPVPLGPRLLCPHIPSSCEALCPKAGASSLPSSSPEPLPQPHHLIGV